MPVTNHYYEVSVKSHTWMEDNDLKELESLLISFFDLNGAGESISVEHVDTEYV